MKMPHVTYFVQMDGNQGSVVSWIFYPAEGQANVEIHHRELVKVKPRT
jgi:hypothetical protein